MVLQSNEKLFAVNFVLEWDIQRMMGTIECSDKADALKVAKDLVSTGVHCQARPDLAYTTPVTNEYVIPFRLYEELKPLTQEARDRIQAAEAKRARKAAKRKAIATVKKD